MERGDGAPLVFEGDVRIGPEAPDRPTFRARSTFVRCHAGAGFRASGIRFESDASFRDSTFAGPCSFARSTFSARAEFAGMQARRVARFEGTRFLGPAAFAGSSFAGRADFRRSEFGGATSFDRASFDATGNFENARFSLVRFQNVSARTRLNFKVARFESKAYFHGAVVSGEMVLRGAQTRDRRIAPGLAAPAPATELLGELRAPPRPGRTIPVRHV